MSPETPPGSQVRTQRLTADVDGPFVVFLIGMRINRLWKLGKWLPVVRAMPRMLAELRREPESGLLSASFALMPPTLISVQYWRSFEDLERYARSRDREHWPAWVAFNKAVGSNGDVGIFHETFLVDAGRYEAVYNNMPPFGLGTFAPLVSATERRASAAARLGLQSSDVDAPTP